jgi:hypothetical protein
MVNVFCDKRGVGKTKVLISMANEKVLSDKGAVVYIGDDYAPCYVLDRRIRFVCTKDFDSIDADSIYGFLCGLISGNYDIDAVYIDGIFNVSSSISKEEALLFHNIEKISSKNGIDFFINVNIYSDEIPNYIEQYRVEYALA